MIFSELDSHLDSKEADQGIRFGISRELISRIPGDEDDAWKYFVEKVIHPKLYQDNDSEDILAARSYRAALMLKEDLSLKECPSVLITNSDQAGLLAKDLFTGLSISGIKLYTVRHILELLDALLEAYPEKVITAAASGGKMKDNFGPLLSNNQTLSILTHIVCYGCTGRKGIASAEKSAQHTVNLYHQNMQNGVGLSSRKKFVRECKNFQLLDRLAEAIITSTEAELGEEVCEAVLVMVELIGYPPEEQQQIHRNNNDEKDEIVVGEELLLSPLASKDWWRTLIGALCQPTCTAQQRLAISRTCMQVFSLATGSSSRICKSHAPATDPTEQVSEKVIDEAEEKLTNRLIEWGLTDKIHTALITQLPLLIKALDLPIHGILEYQATFPSERTLLLNDTSMIRHPGKYKTVPLGCWRVDLLTLLKEIVTYSTSSNDQQTEAIKSIMDLPLPIEFDKVKTAKTEESKTEIVHNPWPAICSFIWAYPNNDFIGIIFFEMLRSIVLIHHEPTLRLILSKSKFLTKAIKSVTSCQKKSSGVILQCLNLLRLRAQSIPPSQFLPQYLNSHDGWKENVDALIIMTMNQQTPIKDGGKSIDIELGSNYAKYLGLADLTEYDSTTTATHADPTKQSNPEEKSSKKNKKKKKKKKK